MKVEVLGCSGGKTRGANLPSFLIDDRFLLDCGSVCSVLSLDRQLKIEAVFLSHSHFDHICDLPFLVDNFSIAGKQLKVYASPKTIDILKAHVFNGEIWPDFSTIPTRENPSLFFYRVNEGDRLAIGDYSLSFFHVFHTTGSLGIVLKNGDKSLAYTADTYRSDGLWDFLKKEGVGSVITECSFPGERKELSEISRHLSTLDFKEEMEKMKGFKNIFVFHTKPHYREKIERELKGLNVRILRDGDVFEV